MPELPELEVVREVLQRRALGETVAEVQVLPPGGPIVIRDMIGSGFAATLAGQTISGVARRGKFLVLGFGERQPPCFLAINPKLSGRLQLAQPADRRLPKTLVIFTLASGAQLRYVDPKQMGQVYLTERMEAIQEYGSMGPEALDISLDDFRARLKPFRGEIKGVLTRGEFVAGIGNAYADEILWEAQLHPFRKRTQLTVEEIERLYHAMRATLLNAIERVRLLMGEDIHEEPREFMAVHMKTGEPCPRCGAPISMIGANQRITNFCRHCQPGGLIKGMSC
ncbi:MAG TPA: DNA-formamidopyrimidine glycosylase family protein [Anaerolineales bacterium]|nr:DNA-formamidopyrimidine glycosylase family protein [Anaerolineales bacterium]